MTSKRISAVSRDSMLRLDYQLTAFVGSKVGLGPSKAEGTGTKFRTRMCKVCNPGPVPQSPISLIVD